MVAWDPLSETWEVAGSLEGVRAEHAVVEVERVLVERYCVLS